tara:strand:- start:1787 stop:2371 length:585 start_codon:yes stop_codon:yes gene_type:complete
MDSISHIFSTIKNEFDLHTIIQSLGDFSEPFREVLHNIKSKYMDSFKIIGKLLLGLVALLKVLYFWYILHIFENKDIQLDKLINLKNYPIIGDIWPIIEERWSNIKTHPNIALPNFNLDREFITECRNITLEKSLPHKYITKSLTIYTGAKVFTILLGIFELYKLIFKSKLEDELSNKLNDNCEEKYECTLTKR